MADEGADRPDRHRTLDATIAWSYDLLDTRGQAAFRHLSVFVGGFGFEAAEMVLSNVPGHAVNAYQDFRLLVDHSLLRAEEQFQELFRYRMLEPLRSFGRKRLQDGGEEAAAIASHARYFRLLAAEAFPDLRSGTNEKVWLDRLEADLENLRIALESTAATKPKDLLGFAACLAPFHAWRGRDKEIRAWLERSLEKDDGTPSAARARGLWWLGAMLAESNAQRGTALVNESVDIARALGLQQDEADALIVLGKALYNSGEVDVSEENFTKALMIFIGIGDESGVARATCFLSITADARGEIDEMDRLAQEALRINRRLDNARGTAICLRQLGAAAGQRGDSDAAVQYLQESLALFELLSNPYGLADVIDLLGDVHLEREEFEQAEVLFSRSGALAKEIGWKTGQSRSCLRRAMVAIEGRQIPDAAILLEEAFDGLGDWPWGRVYALIERTRVNLATGEPKTAATGCLEGLTILRDLGDPLGEAHAVRAVMNLASHLGQVETMTRFLGAVTMKQQSHQAGQSPSESRADAQAEVKARGALGEPKFTLVMEEGQVLPWDDVVNEALAFARECASDSRPTAD